MAITGVVETDLNPSASTETELYAAPSSGRAIIEVVVTSRSSSLATFRIAVVPGGGSPSAQNWRSYDRPIRAKQELKTRKFVLGPLSEVWVWADDPDINFFANGLTST